jgi:hypothetical protein
MLSNGAVKRPAPSAFASSHLRVSDVVVIVLPKDFATALPFNIYAVLLSLVAPALKLQ